MATEDERGFKKADMQVMDPRQVNFQDTGKKSSVKNKIQNGFLNLLALQ